jgi:ATP-binding cassette subfamily B protein
MRIFLKLIPHLKGVLDSIILAVVTGIANQGSAIACSAYGAYLVSAAVLGAPPAAMVAGIRILIILVIVRAGMSYAEMWYAHKAAYGILAQLRVKLYRAIERIAPAYLMNKRTGELSSTLMSDVETLEWFYAHTYGAAIIAVAVPAAVLAVIAAVIHPLIAAVLIPWLALTVTIPFWFKNIAKADGKTIRENLAAINAEVVDGIQGVREILSFGYESMYLKKLKKTNRALSAIQRKYGSRQGLESGLLNISMSAGLLSVTLMSVHLIRSGMMTNAWYAVAVILSIYVFVPVIGISTMARNFGIMQSATERVFTVLETPQTVRDPDTDGEPIGEETDVVFCSVGFSYGEGMPQVLHDVSFRVSCGETVALAGHSGAGKSTCMNLLMRFWDVTGGSICVGGRDVRTLKQSVLRDAIAIVPQDVYLFNCSIAENIKLGKPDALDKEVVQAAKDARIHSFISELPERYDTVVGERGVQLSGGQRQRIAIARALLKNAPILLMDEAVSNLDTKNEVELREAIDRLRKNRLTIVIAHRLSTILSADRIVVMEDGRVSQIGTHEEMLKQGGAYQALIHSQFVGKGGGS